jgi:hypothetical protein
VPADFIIKTGDFIKFTVPPPLVIPMIAAPVPLIDTSMDMCDKRPICLFGDELPPTLLVPLPYIQAAFVGGMGTLKVMLTPLNMTLAAMTTNSKKPMLIKGAVFPATFTVTVPAMQPTPAGPIPDPVLLKPLTAEFVTTTVLAKAG